MLTLREIIILEKLNKSISIYSSAKILSRDIGVSIRTIKSEIDYLRRFLKLMKYGDIESISSKGYQLKINDKKRFDEFICIEINSLNLKNDFENQASRINYLLECLVNNKSLITKWELLERMNISESTLYLDIKEVQNILEEHNLRCEYRTKKGYKIIGSEKNKRKLIISKNVNQDDTNNKLHLLNIKEVTKIREILVEILLINQYKISENLLENLIIHISLALYRIQNGKIIDEDFSLEPYFDKEVKMSKDILHQLLPNYINSLQAEVKFLAINLRGKRDYEDYTLVSDEVNCFITDSIQIITQEYGVDFSDIIDLKVILALHFIPLITRMKNDMQLKNPLLSEIKQTFPLAFDIASYFGSLTNRKFNIQMQEDEISYLTLYFNFGLEESNLKVGGKRILIISSMKQSETILIRQKLDQWFHNIISTIKFVNTFELQNIDLTDYDALLTTEKNSDLTKGAAVFIHPFPNQTDFSRISIAINGFNTINSVLLHFNEKLFFRGAARDKKDIIEKLVCLADSYYRGKIPQNFKNLVFEREKLSATYFDNGIAIPHPLYPITADTFVVVGILENEILWDEEHNVNIVFLVSTEIDNPKAYQLWPYLSSIVCNENAVKEIRNNLTYEKIIEVIEKYLVDKF